MNSILLNIIIVYSVASFLYMIYIIYKMFFKKEQTISYLLKDNEELLEKYKTIKKQHSMVFIISIIIGLIILIFTEPDKMKELIINNKFLINDIQDIKVI
jgi:formate-dependent nitrite reductase membrane component NrfD